MADPRETKTNELEVKLEPGKTREQRMAEIALSSVVRNALQASGWSAASFSGEQPGIQDSVAVVKKTCAAVREGEFGSLTDVLAAQVHTLDAVFTEMARRASMNLGINPEVVDKYLRLAMKAQTQTRATIETLDRMSRGGEQIVKHVHVDNRGGQAVIAETVHTGGQNGKANGQPHAQRAPVAALSSPDPLGYGVPLAGIEGQETVPHARGKVTGGTKGQRKRPASRPPVG